MLTASIVSHGHGKMVAGLAEDLLACAEVSRILITQNIAEDVAYPFDPRVEVRRNKAPHGYGANQNAAFAKVTTPFFCVLNPDIRLQGNPFPALLDAMRGIGVAASAPVVVTPSGRTEDSARRFPSAIALLGKAIGAGDGTYTNAAERQDPDWLAGMFLLLRSDAFREIGGFDERFFLYYEDVDLCWRLRRRGHALRQIQKVSVIHDARRASRRDWQHACWHLASMARYLFKTRSK
jgi:N-acetylglucosaminyl-diphospho-decaprenol L-rhamnosyltransferase